MADTSLTLNLAPAPTLRSFASFCTVAKMNASLSQEQETWLLGAWQNHQDANAVKQLVLAHLKLVVKVVKQHAGYGMAEDDLAQEGVLGLMKAIQKFDLRMKVRLATYALWWIQAEIREFIFNNWRLVKLPGSEGKKLFFNYRKTREKLTKLENKVTVDQGKEDFQTIIQPQLLAKELGTSEANVDIAESYFSQPELSWEGVNQGEDYNYQPRGGHELMVASGNGGDTSRATQPTSLVLVNSDNFHLQSPEENLAQQQKQQLMRQLMAALPEREKLVLQQRYPMEGETAKTLKEISEAMQISMERVRQLEVSAIKRIKERLNLATVN